jgi:sRNA-binding protein
MEQQGHEHNIHRYFGYRLDVAQRRFRVYNEICEYGDLLSAMQVYEEAWTRRRYLYRWNEMHPELEGTRADLDDDEIDTDTAYENMEKAREAAWNEYAEAKAKREAKKNGAAVPDSDHGEETKAQRLARRRRTAREFDSLPEEFSTMAGRELDDLEDKPIGVIPEEFLWHVFHSLVNALTILHQGSGHEVEGKPWKEIVHRDIHTGNIFIRPQQGEEGELVPEDEEEGEGRQIRRFTQDQVSHPSSHAYSFPY